jgi:hypothetical protein
MSSGEPPMAPAARQPRLSLLGGAHVTHVSGATLSRSPSIEMYQGRFNTAGWPKAIEGTGQIRVILSHQGQLGVSRRSAILGLPKTAKGAG